MPTTPSTTRYLTIVEAAARLQPHLGNKNATYWLTDMRRTEPVYVRRVFNNPTWVKDKGVIKYAESEIDRVIEELALFGKHRSVTRRSAPSRSPSTAP
jgi:hypothetical protein